MKIVVVVNKHDLYNYLNYVKKEINHEIVIVNSIKEANEIKGDIVVVSYNECPSHNPYDFDKKYRLKLNKNYKYIIYHGLYIDDYKKRIRSVPKLDKYSNIIFAYPYNDNNLFSSKKFIDLIQNIDFNFNEEKIKITDKMEILYKILLTYENGVNTNELENVTGINKRSIERYMLALAKVKKNIGYYNHLWYIVK